MHNRQFRADCKTGPDRGARPSVSVIFGPGAVFSGGVLAQLPTVANPSRGVTAGDYLRLVQDYLFDFALLVGLVIAAFALFKVAAGALVIYHQVQEGKARWGDLGMHLGVGAGLLLVIVFLVTQASGVL